MSKTSKSQLIVPIGSIILGILFFIFPNQIFDIIFYIVGAVIIIFGVYSLVINIKDYKEAPNLQKVLILLDILTIVLGVLFVALAHIFVVVFLVILGIAFILFGVYGIWASMVDMSLTTSLKVINTIIYALDFVIGITLLCNLDRSTEWVMYFLGAILLINGILLISTFIKASINEKKFDKAIKSEEAKVNADVIDVEVEEK